MRMGMRDMTYSRNYRANESKFEHHDGPIVRGQLLDFFDQKVRGLLKIVIETQFDHSSESSAIDQFSFS
jgi:hypothetical protein